MIEAAAAYCLDNFENKFARCIKLIQVKFAVRKMADFKDTVLILFCRDEKRCDFIVEKSDHFFIVVGNTFHYLVIITFYRHNSAGKQVFSIFSV